MDMSYTPELGPLSLVLICCNFRSSFICLRLLMTISGLEMLRVKLESGAASYSRLAMFSLLLACCRWASFSRFFSSFFSRRDNRRSRSGAGAVVLVVSPRPLHYTMFQNNIPFDFWNSFTDAFLRNSLCSHYSDCHITFLNHAATLHCEIWKSRKNAKFYNQA